MKYNVTEIEFDLDDMFYDYEFVDIKEESELINPEPEVF